MNVFEKLELSQGDLLANTASSLVLYKGSFNAELLIVGEAPGVEEDRQGKPFVGDSGKLLDELLIDARLTDKKIMFINSVFRAPRNGVGAIRTPTNEEILAYSSYVNEIVTLVSPKVILALGNCACYSLMRRKSISKIRGHWHGNIMPSYHPSHILRNKEKRCFLLSDLIEVSNTLKL